MVEESEDSAAYWMDELRLLIWSGFFNENDFDAYLDDLQYDEEAAPHLPMLRDFGSTEMVSKRKAEGGWETQTDCDRLDATFSSLRTQSVLALQNAGYTTSDAHGDAWNLINQDAPDRWLGFCYYHGQDVERALSGNALYIGFDAVAADREAKVRLGEIVARALRDAEFTLEWNGDPETRMTITNIHWQKRTNWVDQQRATLVRPKGFFSWLRDWWK
jgi:hypothetical protein